MFCPSILHLNIPQGLSANFAWLPAEAFTFKEAYRVRVAERQVLEHRERSSEYTDAGKRAANGFPPFRKVLRDADLLIWWDV